MSASGCVLVLAACVTLVLSSSAFGRGCAPGAGPGEALSFQHRCAEPGQGYGARRADYACFVSPDGLGAVAAGVKVGWIGAQSESEQLGAVLEAARLAITRWAGREVEFRLTGRVADPHAPPVTGAWVGGYDGGPWGEYPSARVYRLDDKGALIWSTFPEQEAAERWANVSRWFALRHAPEMPSGRVALGLDVRPVGDEEFVSLAGPYLEDVGSLFGLPRPVFRVLGPLDFLNPAQEGGLVWTLRHNWRYRKCAERRAMVRARILEGPL